jgi:ADP-heptose:LPS heptosyltransferase
MDVRLMKQFDAIIGRLITLMLPRSVIHESDRNFGSFLLIRPGGIGDAVLLVPAIRALKIKYPDARITVLAERRNGAIFSLCPAVDHLLLYDRKTELLAAIRGRYDVVIDTEQWHRLSAVVARMTGAPVSIGFATNERKRLFSHQVAYSHDDYETESFFRLLQPLGIAAPAELIVPFLDIPVSARQSASTALVHVESRPFAVLFPGASISERRWGAGHFRELALRLQRSGIGVVVVGGGGDRADGDLICADGIGLNLAGRTTLAETAAVIQRTAVLVSGDSGILHIGVGLGVPTVSLFGPGIAAKWAPRGERHIVINRELPCSPCTRFGTTPPCPEQGRCIAAIPVDEVEAAVRRLMVGTVRDNCSENDKNC